MLMVQGYIAPNRVKELYQGSWLLYVLMYSTYIHTVALIHTDDRYIVVKCCHLEEQKKQREQSVGYIEVMCHLLTYIYNLSCHQTQFEELV